MKKSKKISKKNNKISPINAEKLTLKDMVSKITADNRHPVVDWGKPVGKEVW